MLNDHFKGVTVYCGAVARDPRQQHGVRGRVLRLLTDEEEEDGEACGGYEGEEAVEAAEAGSSAWVEEEGEGYVLAAGAAAQSASTLDPVKNNGRKRGGRSGCTIC